MDSTGTSFKIQYGANEGSFSNDLIRIFFENSEGYIAPAVEDFTYFSGIIDEYIDNEYHHVLIEFDDNEKNVTVYIDNTIAFYNDSWISFSGSSTDFFTLNINGVIDEYSFWERNLLYYEREFLNNSGTPFQFTSQDYVPPANNVPTINNVEIRTNTSSTNSPLKGIVNVEDILQRGVEVGEAAEDRGSFCKRTGGRDNRLLVLPGKVAAMVGAAALGSV